MRERAIASYLFEYRRAGIKKTAPSGTTEFLKPSGPVTGRYEGNKWFPPSESTASRTPPARSKGHSRGAFTEPLSQRSIVYESGLERSTGHILAADRRVSHLQDQPNRVEYQIADDEVKHHTFDYLATDTQGKRHAFAVKPQERKESSGVCEVVNLIQEQNPDWADTFKIVTENEISRVEAKNASWILHARRARNNDDVAAVHHLAMSLMGTVSIIDLARASGLGARGFNAVVNLIDEGVLELVSNERINDHASVRLHSNFKAQRHEQR